MDFNFGDKQIKPETAQVKSRYQLEYPLDLESIGGLREPNRMLYQERRRVQALTILSGAVTFAVAGEVMLITGAAGVTIATITGGYNGQQLTLIFTDANITITDTAAATLDTVNLSAAFTSTANDVLVLINDGVKWIEMSRSLN